MDSSTIGKNFKYNSPQQPMYTVRETPLHYRSFSQTKSNFEDLSFSTYIQSQDPTLKSQKNDDTEISIFDAQKYFSETNDPNDIKRQQNQEPSPDLLSVPRLSSVSSVDGYGRNFRTRSFHATPTASSEASWNSQTGLLANRPGSFGVSIKNLPSEQNKQRNNSVPKKWSFGRKCCCTGQKSVDVREITSDSEQQRTTMAATGTENSNNAYLYTKRDQTNYKEKAKQSMSPKSSIVIKDMVPEFESTDALPRQQRVSASGRPFATDGPIGFSFPILSPSSQTITKPPPIKTNGIRTKPIIITQLDQDPPRVSLEVFQPISTDHNSLNPRPHLINPGSPIARVINTDDDVASDASSDLFEIESFSTQTTSYPMYRRRDSLDEAHMFNARRFNIGGRRSLDEPPTPSVAATECYAPSEVSIDWSVTTAEGYDRASVASFSVSASDIGKAAFLRQRIQEEEAAGGGGDGGKRKGNGGGGILMMSCRQEKAVSVGPQPVKYAVGVEGPPSILSLHGGGRPPRAANKPPLGSSQSARLSLAFAA
ncbi:hypothetical protein ACJIZ3_005518 [Penstemon smallii]|uniref:Uncharacterized protein n=1 Tax=Penstemon smallii TaxID=265156 RepID=A0ABD3S5G6_9LAMI